MCLEKSGSQAGPSNSRPGHRTNGIHQDFLVKRPVVNLFNSEECSSFNLVHDILLFTVALPRNPSLPTIKAWSRLASTRCLARSDVDPPFARGPCAAISDVFAVTVHPNKSDCLRLIQRPGTLCIDDTYLARLIQMSLTNIRAVWVVRMGKAPDFPTAVVQLLVIDDIPVVVVRLAVGVSDSHRVSPFEKVA